MPLYSFRLEAQDGSGHFRQGTTEAESKDDARNWLELQELQKATFRLTDERAAELCDEYGADSVDELPKVPKLGAPQEAKAAFRAMTVRDRAHLNIHRQTKPYKLVKLEEVK